MHNISKDMRRATRDMDIDFIKYSLEDKSIRNFIKELNIKVNSNILMNFGFEFPLNNTDFSSNIFSLIEVEE